MVVRDGRGKGGSPPDMMEMLFWLSCIRSGKHRLVTCFVSTVFIRGNAALGYLALMQSGVVAWHDPEILPAENPERHFTLI